jgi:hypothetical protein
MNGHRMTCLPKRNRPLSRRAADGVILLVMLGLLSIFTLVAVTFVVSAGHARRGARAASTAEQMGDPFDVLLNQAMMQVVRGSNHPQSAIGPWGILEDMYGNSDVVTGAVYHSNETLGQSIYDEAAAESRRANNNAFSSAFTDNFGNPTGPSVSERFSAPMFIEIGAVSFGWDREPGVALVDDAPSNGIIDDADEWLQGDDSFLGMTKAHPATLGIAPSGWQGAWSDGSLPLIDNVDNYYAGRVITFINGDCAGQSSHIVRSKIVNPGGDSSSVRTILFIQPFDNGSQPRKRDRFVINGRPFNGTGAGYSPYKPKTQEPKTAADISLLRALDMPYHNSLLATPGYGFDELEAEGEPVAILPNPTDSGYRDYLTRFNPIVAMDEDYDAPDEQNMHMSYTAWVNGGYKTIIPSFHRPDLVRYHTAEHVTSGPQRWLNVPPYIRRRYILRPDPSDHYDYTQEPNATNPAASDGWTPGEPFEDWNGNGQWDPIARNPVTGVFGPEKYDDLPPKNNEYDIGDRSYFNTGIDMMDGPWDVDNNGDGAMDSIWLDLGMPVTSTPDGRFIKPLFAILIQDLDGRINVNAHGSSKHYTHVHNDVYQAEGAFNPEFKPSESRFGTEERVRMGIYNYAMLQLVMAADGSPIVNTSTGAGSNVVRTHSVGDMDSNFNKMSPQDVKFASNRLFALSYRNDAWGLAPAPAVPNGALMFDINGGFRSILDGNADYNKIVNGFEPAVGQGWSVADVNIAQVLHSGTSGLPSLPSPANPPPIFPRYNPIRRIIEGQGDSGGQSPPILGRYGEAHLLRPTGQKFSAATPLYGYYPGLGVTPKAGITDLFLPRPDYYSTFFANSPSAFVNATTALVPKMDGTAVPAATFYGAAIAEYQGDDDNPRLPAFPGVQNPSSDARFLFGSKFRNSFPTRLPTTKELEDDSPSGKALVNAIVGKHNSYVAIGDYGTPADFDSDGFVALDIMGNPIYEKMGTEYEDVDAPTEINLNRRYFAQTYFSGRATPGGRLKTTDIDSPYTPAELERLLRSRDANSSSLPSRLRTNFYKNNEPYVAGDADRSTTSEQWDVPCPHIAPTPELSSALVALGLPLVNPSLGDLLRARFYLASGRSATASQTAQLATIAMRSYRLSGTDGPVNQQLPLEARKRWHTRLLSPDLGMGVKMDLNAPFGNARDDNGNNVVDDPREANVEPLAGSAGAAFAFDGNRDGNFVSGIDEEARQQYAKELYCLMMLLVDENYAEPKPTSINAAGTGPGAESTNFPFIPANDPKADMVLKSLSGEHKTRRWLFARKIAQWAVNTVDFRDRDAIMTPFEFDVDPFFDNDDDTSSINISKPNSNGTWDVDGYVIANRPDLVEDMDKPWRGLVWGCEFPDLILTESVAFHDRRTQNLRKEPGIDNGLTFALPQNTFSDETPPTPLPPEGVDPDWDQRRVPQGTALFELYATGNRHNPALPRELYTLVTYTDPISLRPITEYKLDLGRLAGSSDPAGTQYPVWRLAITESHTRPPTVSDPINDMKMSIAERIQEWPMTCSLELSDPGMSLLNPQVFSNVVAKQVPIERVVHFSENGSFPNLHTGAKEGLVTSAGDNKNIEVYSNRSSGGPPSAYLAPGDYAVIGPHRVSQNNGLRNITTIGRTEKMMVTTTVDSVTGEIKVVEVPYAQPQQLIDLGEFGVRPFCISSVNGVDEYPRMGYPSSFNALGGLAGLLKMPNTAEVGWVDNPNTTGAAITPLPPPEPELTYPAPVPPANVQQIRPPLAIPVAVANGQGLGLRVVGLNISEPNTTFSGLTAYYPAPNLDRPDAWNPSFVTRDQYSIVRDTPLDDDLDGNRLPPSRPNTMLPHFPASPPPPAAPIPGQVQDQTLLNFKTVFLQRLANPLESWDKYTNPYITIDWMPIDLTIFNGEPFYFEKKDPPLTPATTGVAGTDLGYLSEPIPPVAGGPQFRFGSRQRGAPRYPVRGLFSMFDLWSQPNWLDPSPEFDTRPPLTGPVSESVADITTVVPATTKYRDYYAVGPVRWQHPLDHTLGYLNMGYHVMRDWPKDPVSDPKMLRISPVREPIRRPMSNAGVRTGFYTFADVTRNNDKYIGAPKRPFNWLTWNNRPFAGSMELMLVPCTTQARLLHEYSMRRTTTPSAPDGTGNYANRLAPFDPRRAANHYMPPVPAAGHTNWQPNASPIQGRLAYGYSVTAPFAHLLNFFESTNAVVPAPGDPTSPEAAPNLFRLFEFVTVPSRFSGTKQMHLHLSRNNAAAPGSGTPAYGTADEHLGWPFTAPFNYIPLYREPGRININTIIPLDNHGFPSGSPTSSYTYAGRHRGERLNDDGAGIWRSVLNDFHPMIRWLPLDNTAGSGGMRADMSYPMRAGSMVAAAALSSHRYFFNPSEDTIDNFYSLFASMISDDPAFDPRGADGVFFNGDDAFNRPFSQLHGPSRQDPSRPSYFANPFRSFMSDYSAVIPGSGKNQSFNGNPLLAADSTLMRRRDTTWSPWHSNWKPTSADANDMNTGFDSGPASKLFSPAQIDPRFDPMFTLNYPRPFKLPPGKPPTIPPTVHTPVNPAFPSINVGPSWWQYSGYSSPLFDARAGTMLSYGTPPTAPTVDAMRVRDTDYRNTDRSPFFRYQMYTKLSNHVTTRSNVYAIWITIGFFECERVQPGVPFPVQTGHSSLEEFATKHRYPDGFRILRELGSDSGEAKRHRSFAIVDRTIPVGFMRGENLNVDRAFLINHIVD